MVLYSPVLDNVGLICNFTLMATIQEMLDKWQSVNLESEIPIIIQRNSEKAADLNRKQLYDQSVRSDGQRLNPYQSPAYALEKNRINPTPGLFRPDFYVTGAFNRGIYAQVKAGKSIIFGSTDFKSERLEKRDTNKIFGLTMDSKQVFLDETVMPEIRSYITRITGLTFR